MNIKNENPVDGSVYSKLQQMHEEFMLLIEKLDELIDSDSEQVNEFYRNKDTFPSLISVKPSVANIANCHRALIRDLGRGSPFCHKGKINTSSADIVTAVRGIQYAIYMAQGNEKWCGYAGLDVPDSLLEMAVDADPRSLDNLTDFIVRSIATMNHRVDFDDHSNWWSAVRCIEERSDREAIETRKAVRYKRLDAKYQQGAMSVAEETRWSFKSQEIYTMKVTDGDRNKGVRKVVRNCLRIISKHF